MAGSLFSNAVINFTINAQNALQELTGFQQKFSSGISQMRGLLAGFVGFQGLRGAYSSIMNLVDAADKLDMPVEEMSRFANVFTEFGGSTDEAVASLEKFDQMARQLKFHSSGPLRELSAVLRTNLANKDYQGLISAFREQFKQLSPDGRREVESMLGVDSVALRNMLRSTDAEYKNAIENSKQFSVVTEENAKSIRDMRKALSETKQALQQTAIPFLEALKPVLEIVRDLIVGFNNLPASVKSFAADFVVAFAAINAALKTTALLTTIASGGANIAGAALALGITGAAVLGVKAYKANEKMRPQLEQDALDNGVAPNKYDWLFGKKAPLHNLRLMALNLQSAYKNAHDDAFLQPPVVRAPTKADAFSTQAGNSNKTTETKNDNRVYNLTFNGIENPNDFINAFQSVATQGLTPIMGAQG